MLVFILHLFSFYRILLCFAFCCRFKVKQFAYMKRRRDSSAEMLRPDQVHKYGIRGTESGYALAI